MLLCRAVGPFYFYKIKFRRPSGLLYAGPAAPLSLGPAALNRDVINFILENKIEA